MHLRGSDFGFISCMCYYGEKTQIEKSGSENLVEIKRRLEQNLTGVHRRASGHSSDNDISKAFVQPSRNTYRTSIRFRDTETIDQKLNQDGHRHWVPNPEAPYF